jgi:hypothetical protein
MATLFNNVANTLTTNFVPVQATFDTSGNFITFIGPGGVAFTTGGGSLAINTTAITGGTSGNILYDNAGKVGEKAVTGTGNVVLSDSPTLTGNVSANVNLRSGSLSSLLSLAGGTSEIGYATDVDTLVKFNGTTAEVYGKQGNGTTLNYTITNANYTAVIDCNNVSYLNIMFDSAFTATLSNLNIKLPATSAIPSINELTVSLGYCPTSFTVPFTFTLSYQAIDITNSANTYNPIPADGTTTNVATIRHPTQSNSTGSSTIKFISNWGGSWTRLPTTLESVATTNYSNFIGVKGQIISGTNTSTGNLTSTTVANSSSLPLTPGAWLITSSVLFTTSVGFTASFLGANAAVSATNSAPNSASNSVIIQVPTTTGTQIMLQIPTQIVYVTSNLTYYGNVQSTFTAGSVSATVYQTAIRLI